MKGLTLIEVLIAAAIFVLFALGAYQGYASLYAAITGAREKALAADLANAHFEMIKNMPYSNVGTVGGNPSGLVATSTMAVRDNITFALLTSISNVDNPFDGVAGGADLLPADYKLVEVRITCTGCKNFSPVVFTGWVAPKNLESA